MRESAGRMWSQLREYFAKMPKKNKVQLVILTLIIIALAIVAAVMLSRTEYVVAHSTGNDFNEAYYVYEKVREMGVDAKLEGTSIMVPEVDRLAVRTSLQQQGIIGSADFERDYVNQASGFGVTSDQAKQLYNMQKSSDIRTLILQLNRIQDCRVIAVLGETSPFRVQNNARDATAAITLTLRGGGRLTNNEAQAIGEIVRGSIPGILYENIQIIDAEGNYYRVGDDSVENFNDVMEMRLAIRNRYINEYKTQIEQSLAPFVGGSDNLQVTVNIKLDWDKQTTEKILFDPPVPGELEGLVRSSHNFWEAYRRGELAQGIPGTDPNGMGVVEYPHGPDDDDGMYWKRIEELNYDLNETRILIEHEEGTIADENIAVLINSRVNEDNYSLEFIDYISKALGVPLTKISVQYVPFPDNSEQIEQYLAEREKYEAQQRQREMVELILKWAVILLLGIFFIMLIRKIFVTIKPPPEPEPVLAGAGAVGIDYIIDDDEEEEEEVIYEDLDLNQKSAGLEQIEKFIDKDAAAVAQLLRNWLSDE